MKKYGSEVATKIASKWIPYVWWWLAKDNVTEIRFVLVNNEIITYYPYLK